MSTLLAFNDDAALVGDFNGQVRTEKRPAELSQEDWAKQVRNYYREPEHWYPDEEGAPFTHHTGGYWYDDKGEMNVEVLEGTKPYETISDDAVGLSVRACFLENVHFWVVADRVRSKSFSIGDA